MSLYSNSDLSPRKENHRMTNNLFIVCYAVTEENPKIPVKSIITFIDQ